MPLFKQCWEVNSCVLTFLGVGFGGNLVQGFRIYAWRAVPSFPQIALCLPSFALRPQPFNFSKLIVLLIIWLMPIYRHSIILLRYIADPYLLLVAVPIPEVVVGTLPSLQELPLRLQSQRLPWSLPSQSSSAEWWGKSWIVPSQGLSRINDK